MTAFDRRHRLLHFGCGPHKLPRPWENFDAEVDIRKPLPFPDGSALFVFAEHVIEHVQFSEGMAFLRECQRVLQPSGTLRLSFPDVTRITNANTLLYLDFLRTLGVTADTQNDARRFILEGSGHLSCWTDLAAWHCLHAAGFSNVQRSHYGSSHVATLNGIDGHHLSSSLTAASIETTVLEATK